MYKKFNGMLRQAKTNMMAIIGMMVAVGTVAFTAPKENEIVWFETDALGQIVDVTNGQSASPNGCSDLSSSEYCALGFDRNDLKANGDAPLTGISDSNPNMIPFDEVYREE